MYCHTNNIKIENNEFYKGFIKLKIILAIISMA